MMPIGNGSPLLNTTSQMMPHVLCEIPKNTGDSEKHAALFMSSCLVVPLLMLLLSCSTPGVQFAESGSSGDRQPVGAVGIHYRIANSYYKARVGCVVYASLEKGDTAGEQRKYLSRTSGEKCDVRGFPANFVHADVGDLELERAREIMDYVRSGRVSEADLSDTAAYYDKDFDFAGYLRTAPPVGVSLIGEVVVVNFEVPDGVVKVSLDARHQYAVESVIF